MPLVMGIKISDRQIVRIGEDITVRIEAVDGNPNRVKLVIDAPKSLAIVRE